MPGSFDSSGDIEIICSKSGAASKHRSTLDGLEVGDRVSLMFVPEEGLTPPYSLKVSSPSGASILDSLLRELPTGESHSPPPIEFIVSLRGKYRIEIKDLKGRQRGEATLNIR